MPLPTAVASEYAVELAAVIRPLLSNVKDGTAVAEPTVAAVTVFAKVNTPAFEIVASPLNETGLARLDPLPTLMKPELNVEVSLLLKIVKSADANAPRFVADAVGKLTVVTPVAPTVEIVKSVPAVPVTIV